nr:PIN domain-containing protein [Desulfurococcales archaeon]
HDVYPLFADFEHLPANAGVEGLVEYIAKYRLLPNDALIVATCRVYGIGTIATFDEDFKRVPWLRTVP